MTDGVDKVSLLLGEQGQAIKGLKESFDKHCDDDDRRHAENMAALKALNRSIADNTAAMRKLAGRVSIMQPTVDFFKDNKPKIIMVLGVSTFILTGVGAIVWALVTKYAAAIIAAVIAAMSSTPPR